MSVIIKLFLQRLYIIWVKLLAYLRFCSTLFTEWPFKNNSQYFLLNRLKVRHFLCLIQAHDRHKLKK